MRCTTTSITSVWSRSTPSTCEWPTPHGGVMREGSLAEQFEVLAGLQQQGLIRHLGVSNVGRDQLIEAQSIAPVACVQNAYNVVQRDDEDLVDLCAAEGIAFVPFFPLGGFSPLAADQFAALAGRDRRHHHATRAGLAAAALADDPVHSRYVERRAPSGEPGRRLDHAHRRSARRAGPADPLTVRARSLADSASHRFHLLT